MRGIPTNLHQFTTVISLAFELDLHPREQAAYLGEKVVREKE